jgi:hypothetical protein
VRAFFDENQGQRLPAVAMVRSTSTNVLDGAFQANRSSVRPHHLFPFTWSFAMTRVLFALLAFAGVLSPTFAQTHHDLVMEAGTTEGESQTIDWVTHNHNGHPGPEQIPPATQYVFRVTGASGTWVYPLLDLHLPDLANSEEEVGSTSYPDYTWGDAYLTLTGAFPWLENATESFYTMTNNNPSYADWVPLTAKATQYSAAVELAVGSPWNENQVRNIWQPLVPATGNPATSTRIWQQASCWPVNTQVPTLWSNIFAGGATAGSRVVKMSALVEHAIQTEQLVYNAFVYDEDAWKNFTTNDLSLFDGSPFEGEAPYLVAIKMGLGLSVQFVGLRSGISGFSTNGSYVTTSETTTAGLAGLVPTPPTLPIYPIISVSNECLFVLGRLDFFPVPQMLMTNFGPPVIHASGPHPVTIGEESLIPVFNVIHPATISYRDSLGNGFVADLFINDVGRSSFVVDSSAVTGLGYIASITTPYGTLTGTATRNWAKLAFSNP